MKVEGHLALIGDQGMLAAAVRREAPASWTISGFDLPGFDLTDRDGVLKTLVECAPRVIVNCAAFTDVDGCEAREELATQVNGDGPGYLAEAAAETGATLVHISTDYVFDGTKGTPYTEDDAPAPRSAYGRSKLAGERAILDSGLEPFFILRTSWLYGPGGRNFVETMVRLAREQEVFRVVSDQVGSPTYTADLARAIFCLLALGDPSPNVDHRKTPFGLYHYSNQGSCSWHAFAESIVAELRRRERVTVQVIQPITTAEYPLPAQRPPYSVFCKEKYRATTGQVPPPWQDALARYFKIREE